MVKNYMTLELKREVRKAGEDRFYVSIPKTYIEDGVIKVGQKCKVVFEEDNEE